MNTTAAYPTTRSTPLWHGDQLIGFVAVESSSHGTFAGILSPGPAFEDDRPLFETAVAAEKAIGQSNPHEYQAAWHTWQQACHQLQQLDLSFGDLHIPIEGFAIDADCAWNSKRPYGGTRSIARASQPPKRAADGGNKLGGCNKCTLSSIY